MQPITKLLGILFFCCCFTANSYARQYRVTKFEDATKNIIYDEPNHQFVIVVPRTLGIEKIEWINTSQSKIPAVKTSTGGDDLFTVKDIPLDAGSVIMELAKGGQTKRITFSILDKNIQSITIDEDSSPGDKLRIGQKAFDAGFLFCIAKTKKADKVGWLNAEGKEQPTEMVDENTKSICYYIKDAYKNPEEKTATIRVHNGSAAEDYTLDIRTQVEASNGRTIHRIHPDCPSSPEVATRASTTCSEPGYGNQYGESNSPDGVFPENKIVYVYDFNEKANKRGLYKVYRKRKGLFGHETTLSAKPVNLNTEVLRPKNIVQFKVYNINRFLYNVIVADTLVDFYSEESKLLREGLLGGNLLDNLISSFSGTVTGTKSVDPNKTSVQSSGDAAKGEPTDMLDKVISEIECFSKAYNGLRARMLQAYNPCSKFPCCDVKEATEFHQLINYLAHIKGDLAYMQPGINKKLEELTATREKKKTCETLKTQQEVLGKAVEKLQQQIAEQKDEEKKKPLIAQLTEKQEQQKKLNGQQTDNNCGTIDDAIKQLEEETKPFSALLELGAQLPSLTQLEKLQGFIMHIVEQNQQYLADYIPLDGNRLDLDITIRSKDSIANYFSIPKYENQPIHLEIPIVERLFATFSSGSFLVPNSYLQNKTYTWQRLAAPDSSLSSSSEFILAERGYTPPVSGFAAFMNGQVKLTRGFGIGLSAGVGLTLEASPRLAYLGGGSFHFGAARQFSLTGGVAIMNVERLTNNLQDVADHHIRHPNNTTSIETYKEMKAGYFFAVSYTPFKPVRKRSVQAREMELLRQPANQPAANNAATSAAGSGSGSAGGGSNSTPK